MLQSNGVIKRQLDPQQRPTGFMKAHHAVVAVTQDLALTTIIFAAAGAWVLGSGSAVPRQPTWTRTLWVPPKKGHRATSANSVTLLKSTSTSSISWARPTKLTAAAGALFLGTLPQATL